MPTGYRCFTDYPILSLGDAEGKRAPIRECRLLYVDRASRYATVLVKDGNSWTEHRFKAAYLYCDRGRLESKALRYHSKGRLGQLNYKLVKAYRCQP